MLQISNLVVLLYRVKTANTTVDCLMVELEVRRTARDHALYDAGTGLVDLSLACKQYVSAVFGARSPEARSVTVVKLRRKMRM